MSFLNPTPRFPPYKGPHHVGTSEHEFAAADLDSPSPCPNESITTIRFRLFYPTDQAPVNSNSLKWLPEPPRESLSAFVRFLGASSFVSELFSYLPTLISRITIPVAQNAPRKQSPRGKWPVMIFSHGLGGTTHSYSYLLCSLASHGLVIVAPEHRDGSPPRSIINDPTHGRKIVEYKRISYSRSPENEKARNDQLRIRLWELGLVHDAVLKFNDGRAPNNLLECPRLPDFKASLDVNPGSISWAGHSFGACSMVQFIKSVFWNPTSETSSPELDRYEPLYTCSPDSKLASQITASSPMVLLDLWTLPLRADSTRWLWERPLPTYTRTDAERFTVLAVLSEEFVRWKANFNSTKRILSVDPRKEEPTAGGRPNGPRIFYALRSAHLSQSDFGLLFPWITKKWMGADEPERTIRMNVRAILQMLRENRIAVEESKIDDEEEEEAEFVVIQVGEGNIEDSAYDWKIMSKDGNIRGWVWVSLDDATNDDKKGKL